MTPLSKRKIPEKTKELLEDALAHVFAHMKPEEFRKILPALLTKTERAMLVKRLGIIYGFNQNINEVDIAEFVKTTRQTVARLRLQLEAGDLASHTVISKKLDSWKNISELKNISRHIGLKVIRSAIKNIRFG